MSRVFLRYVDHEKQREVAFASDMISKIEVAYAGRNEDGTVFLVKSLRAADSHTALRVYFVSVGAETFAVPSDEPSKALDVIEQLFRNSLPFSGSDVDTQS